MAIPADQRERAIDQNFVEPILGQAVLDRWPEKTPSQIGCKPGRPQAGPPSRKARTGPGRVQARAGDQQSAIKPPAREPGAVGRVSPRWA